MNEPAPASARADLRAFSAMELLVVIAIGALLTGLLMPAMNRAKSAARETVCRSRLRQWGMAFAAYASENGGYCPHADGRDRYGDEEPFTREGLADYWFGRADVPAGARGGKPWRDHKRNEYPGVESVFQCPSARPASESLYACKPLRNGFFSYAMNSCLELDGNCRPPCGRAA